MDSTHLSTSPCDWWERPCLMKKCSVIAETDTNWTKTLCRHSIDIMIYDRKSLPSQEAEWMDIMWSGHLVIRSLERLPSYDFPIDKQPFLGFHHSFLKLSSAISISLEDKHTQWRPQRCSFPPEVRSTQYWKREDGKKSMTRRLLIHCFRRSVALRKILLVQSIAIEQRNHHPSTACVRNNTFSVQARREI
jgi:pterin-4a-carbinolamine dehydratase